MMQKYSFFLFISFYFTSINFSVGQPLIDYNWNDHRLSLAGSFAFWSTSQLLGKFAKSEVLDDFHEVDRNVLWKLDLVSLRRSDPRADRWSDAALYLSGMMPIALGLSQKKSHSKTVGLGLLVLHGLLLESGCTHFIKMIAERPRPHIYLQGESALNKPISKNSTKSFYSGHTSSSAYFAFFTAQAFQMLYPYSPLRKYVWAGSVLLPALTGYLRVKAGKHFPTDVIVGYLVGSAWGVLLPKIHSKQKVSRVQLFSTGKGIALRMGL